MSRTYRNITKTKQCERFYNLNPRIYIFDLDGTIIDSSHRAEHDSQGFINLELWKEKSTKDYIFQDSLLPLYAKLQQVYKNGDMVILCTARELNKWDWEYIHFHNIYYDRVISRPVGVTTQDDELKKTQCQYLFNLPCYKESEKWFFDDNWSNLYALADLGAVVSHAHQWNKTA